MTLPSFPRLLCPFLIIFLSLVNQYYAFSSTYSSLRDSRRVPLGSSLCDNRKIPRQGGFSFHNDRRRRVTAPAQRRHDGDQGRTDQAVGGGLFLNEIVAQLWHYIALASDDLVRTRLEPRFEVFPGALKTLRFTKIDIGKVPFRLDNFVVHENTNDVVECDFDMVWEGECEIELEADYIGSFGVRKVQLEGKTSLLFKPLTRVLPTFKAFHIAFIDPPKLELEFTGLAQGVVELSVIDKAIRTAIQDLLAEMMVLPVRYIYNMLEEDEDNVGPGTYSFLEAYEPPLGIARVSILRGRGFQVEKTFAGDDIPDVYCCVQLGSNPLYKTATIQNSLEPVWKEERADFLLSDPGQHIRIQAWDEQFGPAADDEVGSASVTVDEMLLAGNTKELELVEQDNKGTGAFITLQCDTFPLTSDLSSFDHKQDENLVCGVLVIMVTRAFDIPLPREEAKTFVKVTYVSHEGAKDFYTGTITDYRYVGADALKPVYDCAFHVPLTTRMIEEGGNSVIFELMNEDSMLGTTLGTTALTLTDTDLLNSPDKTITERRKVGNQGASLEFRVCLRGVKLDESQSATPPPLTGAAQAEGSTVRAVENTGAVRITAVKGRGFKIKRRLFRKNTIPSIYCIFKLDSTEDVWRTSTIGNNASPKWNESKHFALFDDNQMVKIRVFDADKGKQQADNALGFAAVPIGDLLQAEGTTDVELQRKGKGSDAFITLRCDRVDP